MRKNNVLLGLAVIGLVACAGDSGGVVENDLTKDVVLQEPASSEKDSVLTTKEFIPENEDNLWQIDDYAEMISGHRIYDSWDDVPKEKQASAEIYKVLDKKGGFTSVMGGHDGWSEFVLWRMETGNDLLGHMKAECGPVCDYAFEFIILKDGETIKADAMNEVLPLKDLNRHKEKMHKKVIAEYPDLDYPDDHSLIYNFPQEGTSMSVNLMVGADEVVTQIADLSWDKNKFTISKYYEEVDVTP